jgi:hypothetical protein
MLLGTKSSADEESSLFAVSRSLRMTCTGLFPNTEIIVKNLNLTPLVESRDPEGNGSKQDSGSRFKPGTGFAGMMF